MAIMDISCELDGNQKITVFHWHAPRTEEVYRTRWELQVGDDFFSVFHREKDAPDVLRWEEEFFHWEQISIAGRVLILMKRMDDKIYYLECALNRIADGIQIYDRNAHLVFLNQASRQISGIPENINVEGRHLFDLYNLDEHISTVMTSLRTRAPVINRFDDFYSTDGSHIATTTTANPILNHGVLMGTIAFEQDTRVVDNQLLRLNEIRRTLIRPQNRATVSPSKFSGYTFEDVLGSGKKLRDAVALAMRVAMRDNNVMLVGETGTGKEIFSQSIHKASPRSKKKFVAVNCAAVPETLAESIFFGTHRGAFTGSLDKPGLLEEANGGTLFLDELNSMNLVMQSKLLRVIQEGAFRRIGGNTDIHVDVRFISSCNEPSEELLRNNIIRRDLFYRLSAIMIEIPPLREHIEDLDELVTHYIGQKSGHFAKGDITMSPEALEVLGSFDWPGNVRELFHILEYALNVVDCAVIQPQHLPPYLRESVASNRDVVAPDDKNWYQSDLQHIMDCYETEVLKKVLDHYGYNISRTAHALGLRRQSLQYRIKKYGIII